MQHHSPSPKNLSLSERSLAAVWHPCTQMQLAHKQPPLAISRGQGAWLYDEQGKAYFDAISSWWVNLLGHAHADGIVVRAAVAAAQYQMTITVAAGAHDRGLAVAVDAQEAVRPGGGKDGVDGNADVAVGPVLETDRR